jgi:simple sugar transport system substrate-binding protein
MTAATHAVILFDGECNLCNGWVDFVIRRDRAERFRFASLQSEVARTLLGARRSADPLPDTIVLLEDGRTYRRSSAVLRILYGLGFPWSVFSLFTIIPRPVRDWTYNWIARNRYRWFGKRATCRVPSPAERARFLMVLAPLALCISFLSGCTGNTQSADENGRSAIRIVFVTHGQSADPFWSVVSNGARAAARDLDVRVEYQAPTSFDMVGMSNLIEAAVAARPSALVVSVPDTAALGSSIRAAIAAGLPVVTINSGAEAWRSLGALAHIGQTEHEAGVAAGERMAQAGARRALCVNHEVGNAGLDLRCAGFAEALSAAGASARVLAVNLADPDDAQQRVTGALAADSDVDAILTLGPSGAAPTLAALQQTGRAGSVRFGTFDLTPEVLSALRDGTMLFALDQQQYLQGYLPVVFLVKYLETGTIPGGGAVILTGPGFVTRENAADVIDLASRGIR